MNMMEVLPHYWQRDKYHNLYLDLKCFDREHRGWRPDSCVQADAYVQRASFGPMKGKYQPGAFCGVYSDDLPHYDTEGQAMALAEFIHWLPRNAHQPQRDDRPDFMRGLPVRKQVAKKIQPDLFGGAA